MSGIKVKLKPCDGEDCNHRLQHIWKSEGNKKYCKNCWLKIMSGERIVPLIKKQKPIAKNSDKRKKQELAYSILRKTYLNNHSLCEANISEECRGKSSQIHHKAGRIGELLCDDTKFLAVCDRCHDYIENNREEAIKLEFSELRLKYKK